MKKINVKNCKKCNISINVEEAKKEGPSQEPSKLQMVSDILGKVSEITENVIKGLTLIAMILSLIIPHPYVYCKNHQIIVTTASCSRPLFLYGFVMNYPV